MLEKLPWRADVAETLCRQEETEKDAFEKLARMAGIAAAARLLEKNPHTPPSKLLSRVTMAEPHARHQPHAARFFCQHASDDGSASAEAGAEQLTNEEAIRQRCIQLKDRGNSFFRERKWEQAADAYAQGAAMASGLLGQDYDAATEPKVTTARDPKLAALAEVVSVLCSNGANALEKLDKRLEALCLCCRCAGCCSSRASS